jgi:hypothetical protein
MVPLIEGSSQGSSEGEDKNESGLVRLGKSTCDDRVVAIKQGT